MRRTRSFASLRKARRRGPSPGRAFTSSWPSRRIHGFSRRLRRYPRRSIKSTRGWSRQASTSCRSSRKRGTLFARCSSRRRRRGLPSMMRESPRSVSSMEFASCGPRIATSADFTTFAPEIPSGEAREACTVDLRRQFGFGDVTLTSSDVNLASATSSLTSAISIWLRRRHRRHQAMSIWLRRRHRWLRRCRFGFGDVTLTSSDVNLAWATSSSASAMSI